MNIYLIKFFLSLLKVCVMFLLAKTFPTYAQILDLFSILPSYGGIIGIDDIYTPAESSPFLPWGRGYRRMINNAPKSYWYDSLNPAHKKILNSDSCYENMKPFQLFPLLPLLEQQEEIYSILLEALLRSAASSKMGEGTKLIKRDYLFYIKWMNDYVIYMTGVLYESEQNMKNYQSLSPNQRLVLGLASIEDIVKTEQLIIKLRNLIRHFNTILLINQL